MTYTSCVYDCKEQSAHILHWKKNLLVWRSFLIKRFGLFHKFLRQIVNLQKIKPAVQHYLSSNSLTTSLHSAQNYQQVVTYKKHNLFDIIYQVMQVIITLLLTPQKIYRRFPSAEALTTKYNAFINHLPSQVCCINFLIIIT